MPKRRAGSLWPVPAIVQDPDGWSLTEHICSRCLGRVLRRGDTYRCADCGHTGSGSHVAVCTCGVKIAGRDGGFRCRRNTRQSIESPSEIITMSPGATVGVEQCLG